MNKHNYDGYSQQKAEHMQFIKDFVNLKKEFETQGVNTHFGIQTQRRLCDWLTTHIGNEDKILGTFLKMSA